MQQTLHQVRGIRQWANSTVPSFMGGDHDKHTQKYVIIKCDEHSEMSGVS